MAFCSKIEKDSRSLDVLATCLRCRYHRRSTALPLALLAPEGLCLEAFHSLFPMSFAMLSAPADRLADDSRVACPAGKVVFAVSRRPLSRLIDRIKMLAQLAVSALIPFEVIRWRICARVVEASECPYTYKGGEEFEVNFGATSDLCPAASNVVFPYLAENLYGKPGATPWIACPDHRTDVRMAVGGPKRDSDGGEVTCRDHSDIAIKVVDPGGELWLSRGSRFGVPELLEKAGLPCLSYVNVLAPYYRVLIDGGKLGFYTSDYRSAVTQCPSVERKVVTVIKKGNAGETIVLKVRSTKRRCPLGLNPGRSFELPTNREASFWIQALGCLSPYLFNPDMASDSTEAFSLADQVDKPTILRVHREPGGKG